LLELQQKKLELELLQTKNQMEIQKKRSMNKINQSKVNLFYIHFKTYHLFIKIFRMLLMRVHHLRRQMFRLQMKKYMQKFSLKILKK